MKRWLSMAAVAVLSLALVIGIACGGGDDDDVGVKKVKFGYGIPLSGAAGAVAGWPFIWSLEVYQDWYPTFEVAGQTYEWDFRYEDSMPGGAISPAGGYASATKLIYEHGVDFMLEAPTDAALAAIAITEELGILFFPSYCSMIDIGPDTPHTFAVFPIMDLQGFAFFDWLVKEHPEVKTLACTHGGSRTGEDAYRRISAASEYYGLELKSFEGSGEMTVEYYPTATKYMRLDADLVFAGFQVLKPMWEMGYEGFGAESYWAEAGYGDVPWDKAIGHVFIYMPHPMEEPWPEVARFATEYEDRFGVEVTPSILLAPMLIQVLTQALEQAGTVTDTDRIIEALETETFDTMMGEIYFGGEELVGVPHVMMVPEPIWEIVGPGEYELVALYSAEEVEALAIEIYGAR